MEKLNILSVDLNPGRIPFEDVPAMIMASDICAAPVFSGSGTKLKVLEYLAAGKPVVSTKKAIEGIKVRPGKDLIVVETAKEFAEAVLLLIEKKEFASSLGTSGKRWMKINYSWGSIVGEMNRFLEKSKY